MESDVRTQVVSTGLALIAAIAWFARFDGDTFAHSGQRHSFADLNNLTGRFVSQDQRTANHEIADAAVLVIVDIRSADSHRQNANEYLAFCWSWHRALFNSKIVGRVQDRRGHRAA